MKRKKVESLIQEYAVWWTKVLGLGHWDLSFKCADGTIEPASGDTVAGEANVSWKYENAVITFYPDVLKDMSEDEIEKLVVHELMHVFLNEMREEGIDHEERVATMLAKAFLWVKGVDK
jgi:hypothetical protein